MRLLFKAYEDRDMTNVIKNVVENVIEGNGSGGPGGSGGGKTYTYKFVSKGLNDAVKKFSDLNDIVIKFSKNLYGKENSKNQVEYFGTLSQMIDGLKESWNSFVKDVAQGKVNPDSADSLYASDSAREVYRRANALNASGYDLSEYRTELTQIDEIVKKISQHWKLNNNEFNVDNLKNILPLAREMFDVFDSHRGDIEATANDLANEFQLTNFNENISESVQDFTLLKDAIEIVNDRLKEAENIMSRARDKAYDNSRLYYDDDDDYNYYLDDNRQKIRLDESANAKSRIKELENISSLLEEEQNKILEKIKNSGDKIKDLYRQNQTDLVAGELNNYQSLYNEYYEITSKFDYINERIQSIRQEVVDQPISGSWDEKNIEILIEAIKLLIQHVEKLSQAFGQLDKEKGITNLLSQFKDLTQNMEVAKGDEKNLFNPEDVEKFSKYLSDILIKIGEISEQLREIGFADFFTNNAVVELKDILSQFKAESFVEFKNSLSEIIKKFEELSPKVSDMVDKLSNFHMSFNLGEESDTEKWYKGRLNTYENFYNEALRIAGEYGKKIGQSSPQLALFNEMVSRGQAGKNIQEEYGNADTLMQIFGEKSITDPSKSAEERVVNIQRFSKLLERIFEENKDFYEKEERVANQLSSNRERLDNLKNAAENYKQGNEQAFNALFSDVEVPNFINDLGEYYKNLAEIELDTLEKENRDLETTLKALNANNEMWRKIEETYRRRQVTSNIQGSRQTARGYNKEKQQKSMSEEEKAAEQAAQDAKEKTRDAIRDMLTGMASESEGKIEVFTNIITEIKNVTSAITGLQETLKKGLGIKDEEGALSFFETLKKKFDEIAESSEKLQGAFASLVGLIGADKTDLIGIKPETISTVTQAFAKLRDVLQEIYSLQKELGVSAKDVAKAESEAVANSTTASGKPKTENTTEAKKQTVEPKSTVGQEAVAKADQTVSSLQKRNEELKELSSEGDQLLKQMADGFGNAGKNSTDTLSTKLEEGAEKVGQSGQKVTESAVQGANRGAGIASPSKKFIEIGEFCIEGFIIGIQEGAPKIAEVLKDTFDVNKYLKEIISSSSVESVANQLFSHITGKYNVSDENALKENIMSYVNLLNSKSTKTDLKNSIGTIGESLPIKSALETKQRELTEMLNNSAELSADDQNALQRELQETVDQLSAVTSALDKLDQMFKEVGNDESAFVEKLKSESVKIKDLQQIVKDLGLSYSGKLDHIIKEDLAGIVAKGYGIDTNAIQAPKQQQEDAEAWLTGILNYAEKVKASISGLFTDVSGAKTGGLEAINKTIEIFEKAREAFSGSTDVSGISKINETLEYFYEMRNKVSNLGETGLGLSSTEYQNALQMIQELRKEIDEMKAALQSGNTVEVQTEITFLKNLARVIREEIPAAIRTKDAEFLKEEQIVGQVVGKEIAALKHLEEELSKNLTGAISNSFDSENLKNLADVLKATEEKIKAAQDSLANGQNNDIDNTTNSVGRLDSAIKQLGIPENEWEYWIEDLDDIEKRLGRILKITASTRLINKKDAEGNDLLDDSGNPVQERIYTGVTVYGREGTGTYNVRRSEDGRLAISERSIKETPYDAIHDLEVENRLGYLDTLEKNLEKSNAMTEELRKSLQELRNEAQNSNPSAQADPYKVMLEGFNREYKEAIAQAKELEKQNQETYKNELALIKANYDAKTEYNTIKANNLVNPDLTSDDKVVRANEQVISTTNDAAEAVQRLGQMYLDESISAAEYLKAVDMYRSEGSKSSVEKLEKAEYTAAQNKKKADTEEYNAQVKAIEDMITAQSKLNDMKAKQISGKDQSIVMAEQLDKVKVAAKEAEDAVYHLFDMFNEGKISETQLDDALEKFDFGIGGNAQSQQGIKNSIAKEYADAKKAVDDYSESIKTVQDLQGRHSNGENVSGRIGTATREMNKNLEKARSHLKELIALSEQFPELPGLAEAVKDITASIDTYKTVTEELNKFDANNKNTGFENAIKGYETLEKRAESYYRVIMKQAEGRNLTANEYSFLDKNKERFETAEQGAEKFNQSLETVIEKLDKVKEKEKEFQEESAAAMGRVVDSELTNLSKDLDALGNKDGSNRFNVEIKALSDQLNELYKANVGQNWSERTKEQFLQVGEAIKGIRDRMRELNSEPQYQPVNEVQKATLGRRMAEWAAHNSAAKEAIAQINILQNRIQNIDDQGSLNDIATDFERIKKEANEAGKVGQRFGEKLKTSFSNLTRYVLSFASFYRIIGVLKQAVNIVSELDKSFTEMRKVSDESIQSLKNFQMESFSMADKFGTTAKQIQDSTADWLRLGGAIYAQPIYIGIYRIEDNFYRKIS